MPDTNFHTLYAIPYFAPLSSCRKTGRGATKGKRYTLYFGLMMLLSVSCLPKAEAQVPRPGHQMNWPELNPEREGRVGREITGLPTLYSVGAIRFFQKYISPLDGPRCAFTPCCSSYSLACLRRHGLVVGYFRTCDRLMRCHGGAVGYLRKGTKCYDPVP